MVVNAFSTLYIRQVRDANKPYYLRLLVCEELSSMKGQSSASLGNIPIFYCSREIIDMSTFPFGKYINVLWAGDDDTQGNYPRALLLEQKSIFAREVNPFSPYSLSTYQDQYISFVLQGKYFSICSHLKYIHFYFSQSINPLLIFHGMHSAYM